MVVVVVVGSVCVTVMSTMWVTLYALLEVLVEIVVPFVMDRSVGVTICGPGVFRISGPVCVPVVSCGSPVVCS